MRRSKYSALWSTIRREHAVAVCLAIDKVRSERAAQLIYQAEKTGLARPIVLRACERRIEQFRGAERPGDATQVMARAEVLEN